MLMLVALAMYVVPALSFLSRRNSLVRRISMYPSPPRVDADALSWVHSPPRIRIYRTKRLDWTVRCDVHGRVGHSRYWRNAIERAFIHCATYSAENQQAEDSIRRAEILSRKDRH